MDATGSTTGLVLRSLRDVTPRRYGMHPGPGTDIPPYIWGVVKDGTFTEYNTANPRPVDVHAKVRGLAGGRPVVVIGAILQTDDMSGNVSKKYNPHESWCV